MNECSLSILQVADLMQAKYACLTGGKSRRHHTIISFPECTSYPSISDQQFNTLLAYFSSILSAGEIELGVVMVVDRRQDKWSSIKTLLLQISTLDNLEVKKVYVLRPVGFLQRTLTDKTLKFLTPEFKLKVLLLDSCEQLHDYIDIDQLTDDFNGILPFDHSQWIQHRAALEKLSNNAYNLNKTLQKLCQDLEDGEFPNDVAQTQELMKEHKGIQAEIKESIESTVNHGCVLLECIYGIGGSDGCDADSGIAVSNTDASVESNNSVSYPIDVANYLNSSRRQSVVSFGSSSRPGNFVGVSRSVSDYYSAEGSDKENSNGKEKRNVTSVGRVGLMEGSRPVCMGKQMHLQAVSRVLSELEETSNKFDQIWQHHTAKLDQCLQLRRFEEDFKQLQIATNKHILKCTTTNLTFNNTDQLAQANSFLNSFEKESKDDLRRASLLRFRGQKFIEANHYALDCIKPKCSELERVVEVYDEFVKENTKALNKARLFYERIDKVSMWVIKVEDYLVTNNNPYLPSHQRNNTNTHLLNLHAELNHLEFKTSKDFHDEYESFWTSEMKNEALDILTKYDNAIRNIQHQKSLFEQKIDKTLHKNSLKHDLSTTNPLKESQNRNENSTKLTDSVFHLPDERKSSLPTDDLHTNGHISSSNFSSVNFSIYNNSSSSHINPFTKAVSLKHRNLSDKDDTTANEAINVEAINNLSLNNSKVNNNVDKNMFRSFTKKLINKNKNNKKNKSNNINNKPDEINYQRKTKRSFSVFSSSMINLNSSRKKNSLRYEEDFDLNNNKEDVINNNYNIINDFTDPSCQSAPTYSENTHQITSNNSNTDLNDFNSFEIRSNSSKNLSNTNNIIIDNDNKTIHNNINNKIHNNTNNTIHNNTNNTINNNTNNTINNNESVTSSLDSNTIDDINYYDSTHNLEHGSIKTKSVSNIHTVLKDQEQKKRKKFSLVKKKGLERKFSKSISTLRGGKTLEVDEKRKREVLNDLFEAEKAYLEVLKVVKENYIERLESIELNEGRDERLNAEILSQECHVFANWKLIYYFHARIFSRELKQVESSAYADALVSCFSANEDEISQLYAEYSRSQTVSRALIKRIANSSLIEECERDGECRESLDSMLTRPLKQLHIYNELLKELSEITNLPYHEVTERILSKAFDYAPVTGFDGDLKAGGRLILEEDMQVVVEEKRTSGLRMRLSHLSSLRHVFFYEQFILLSKKKEINERNSFDFKSLLPMTDITLTENVKNDKRKFELTLKRTEQVFTFQADTANERDVWVTEIKRALMRQFESLKEEHTMNSASFTQRGSEVRRNLETTLTRNELEVAMVQAN